MKSRTNYINTGTHSNIRKKKERREGKKKIRSPKSFSKKPIPVKIVTWPTKFELGGDSGWIRSTEKSGSGLRVVILG